MKTPSRIGMVLLLGVVSVAAHADNRIIPGVTGSIFSVPNEPLFIGPVGSEIQSVQASQYNSHGILEFIVPSLPDHVTRATLVLRGSSGSAGNPMPPITHQVSVYEGDLVLDVADYDRAASPLVTFQTDSNDNGPSISLDITPAVQAFEGRVLGFRIEVIASGLNDGASWFGLVQFPHWQDYVPFIEIRRGLGPNTRQSLETSARRGRGTKTVRGMRTHNH